MVKVRKSLLAACVVAVSAVIGSAHADALPEKGPNGGLLRESGEHHIELIAKGQALTVHLLDHKNKATNERGVTGSAVVTAGAAKETVALTAQPNGVFTGTGKFPTTGNLQIDVTLSPPNEAVLKVSFDVKR